ncbi:hypothetical protein HYC85_003050 [Camellia sinensis]|uniref:Uncharacterized protein n=1 Tax=Camellia sinensis TaxID=4442 RepID=A0A7J7IB89_CAMSI|nr:hypothetical protein HYC85_003050 [Camellia sinensis]
MAQMQANLEKLATTFLEDKGKDQVAAIEPLCAPPPHALAVFFLPMGFLVVLLARWSLVLFNGIKLTEQLLAIWKPIIGFGSLRRSPWARRHFGLCPPHWGAVLDVLYYSGYSYSFEIRLKNSHKGPSQSDESIKN